MKLIYDMRHLTGRMHGMARYGLELLKAILDADADLTAGVLVRRPEDAGVLPQDPRVVPIAYNMAPYGVQSQLRMPHVLKALKPDIYHCPFYGPPASYEGVMVFTVHDLIHLRFPEHHGLKHRFFYKLVVLPAARRAHAVFTVSRHSKRDLEELMGVDPAKVVVTPNGVGPEFKPLGPKAREAAPGELGLPAEYILGVGNPKPHKNLPALIEAHGMLAGLSRMQGMSPPPLVLVGVKKKEMPALGEKADVVFIDHLDDAGLAKAYAAAKAVVAPSIYEGFGLPALEALACGAAVAAANRASLPEVVGEAGLLVEPDPKSLAHAMARLLTDDEKAQSLRRAGPAQAAKFTWAKAAGRTLHVYRRAVGKG